MTWTWLARRSSAWPATRITPRRAHSSRSAAASSRTLLVLRTSATPRSTRPDGVSVEAALGAHLSEEAHAATMAGPHLTLGFAPFWTPALPMPDQPSNLAPVLANDDTTRGFGSDDVKGPARMATYSVVEACERPCGPRPWRADQARFVYPSLAQYAADTIPREPGFGTAGD